MVNNEQYEFKLLEDLNELMEKHFGEPNYSINSKDNADGTRTYALEVKGLGFKFKVSDKDPHLALTTVLEAAIWEINRRAESEMYGTLEESEIDKDETNRIADLMALPIVLFSFLDLYRNKYWDEDPKIIIGKKKNGLWECSIEAKEACLKVVRTGKTKTEALESACRLAQSIVEPFEVSLKIPEGEIQA